MKYNRKIKIDASIDKVFNFCASPHRFEKYFPYQVRWINKQEKWDLGSVIEFEFRFFFTWVYWKTEIAAYKNNVFLPIS